MALAREVAFTGELFKYVIEHGKGVNERKVVRGVCKRKRKATTDSTLRREFAALESSSEILHSSPAALNLRKCVGIANHC